VDRSGGPDACWAWTGSVDRDGYGKLCYVGRTLRANRAALALHLGRDLIGDVLHRCDNARCVNPSHLFEGTHFDNMRDMLTRSRGRTKLTPADVIAIRAVMCGPLRFGDRASLARSYGITPAHLSLVANGRKWRFLKPAQGATP
jgi:hypothetical protein